MQLNSLQGKTVEANGYQLRLKRGKWYFGLWNKGKDLKLDYGPFTYNESIEFAIKHEQDLMDMDKYFTSQKVNRENQGYVEKEQAKDSAGLYL